MEHDPHQLGMVHREMAPMWGTLCFSSQEGNGTVRFHSLSACHSVPITKILALYDI
jgi:hypothetical protein